ncbi:MAG: 3'(2'),5'-bisphosphate nucleotidase CysQ [Aquisalimonadaceae bacterium]
MNAAALRQLLPETVRIARQAGEAILRIYSTGFTVTRKADDSPVTAADEAAQAVIEDALSRLTPNIPILSEEGTLRPWPQRRQWQTYWLVDPLDGTREFIRRNGQFAVNIALIDAGRPVLGVVHAPVAGTAWYGGPALGAFREQQGGSAERIQTARRPEPPLRVALGRATPGSRTRLLLDRLPEHRIVPCGASIKLCMIADGQADLYPRFGPISEWDIGAPQAILEAAGGTIAHMRDLSPVRYNKRPSLTTSDIVAFGDPSVDWKQFIP